MTIVPRRLSLGFVVDSQNSVSCHSPIALTMVFLDFFFLCTIDVTVLLHQYYLQEPSYQLVFNMVCMDSSKEARLIAWRYNGYTVLLLPFPQKASFVAEDIFYFFDKGLILKAGVLTDQCHDQMV